MNDLRRRLAEQQLNVTLTAKAKDYIIDQGYDPIYGARPLKRFLQRKVETLIGRMIIADQVKPNSTLVVDYDGEKLFVTDQLGS